MKSDKWKQKNLQVVGHDEDSRTGTEHRNYSNNIVTMMMTDALQTVNQ